MRKTIVKAIKETNTGKNIMFKNMGNNHTMNLNEFVNRIESGNSIYSKNYYVRYDSSGKTPVSKPNRNKKDNLE